MSEDIKKTNEGSVIETFKKYRDMIIMGIIFFIIIIGAGLANNFRTDRIYNAEKNELLNTIDDMQVEIINSIAGKLMLETLIETRSVEKEEAKNKTIEYNTFIKESDEFVAITERQIRCQRAYLSLIEKGDCTDGTIYNKYKFVKVKK